MKQSLAERVSRLISASAHALIDVVENSAPDAVMEQAIREVDAAVEETRHELGRVLTAKHHATQQLAKLNNEHETLEAQAEQAVRSGRDDLAMAAIERQTNIEAQLPVLQATVEDCLAEEAKYNQYISALKGKRQEMQDELARFRQRQKQPAAATAAGASGSTVDGKVEKATAAFDQVFQRATGVNPNTVAADRQNAEALAELEQLSKQNRLQERLAQLKAKVK